MPERRVRCYACSAVSEFDGVVPRRAECATCGAFLHCCRNCKFYDPSAYNECRESSAERVVDKEAANFCDFFAPAAGEAGDRASTGSAARGDLEKLFK